MKEKPKKHRLFRKHRIVLWEDEGEIGIGKIVDSTIKQNALKTTLKVGEIAMFKRDPNATEGIQRGRVWLRHIQTMDIGDTMRVPITFMRIPTAVDKKIYKKYRF